MSNNFKSLPIQFQHWFKDSAPRHYPIEDIAECIQKRSDKTDAEHVEVLRMAMESKTPIDPVSIFLVEGKAVLVDGNHRLSAAKELGSATISAHVYKGRTMEDAQTFARWKNNQNGKGLLSQDKAEGIRELIADERYRPLFIEKYRVRPKALAQLAGVSLNTARSHLAPISQHIDAKLNQTIKKRRAEGWSDKKIAEEVDFSEQAVRDRRKKLESEAPENAAAQTGVSLPAAERGPTDRDLFLSTADEGTAWTPERFGIALDAAMRGEKTEDVTDLCAFSAVGPALARLSKALQRKDTALPAALAQPHVFVDLYKLQAEIDTILTALEEAHPKTAKLCRAGLSDSIEGSCTRD